MEWFFVYFVAILIAYVILSWVFKHFWLTFTWNVLGIPPRILDEEIVAKTVESCTDATLEQSLQHLMYGGAELTEAQRQECRANMNVYIRRIIESYIEAFMRK
jgi:hypothetical protein